MMLSEADHRRVAEAARAAEARTTGEVFCIVTKEVSQYREVPLAFAAAVALILPPLLLAIFGVPALTGWLGQLQPADWSSGGPGGGAVRTTAAEAITAYAIAQAVLFGLVAFIVAIPPVRRAATPRFLKRHRVRRTAYAHFASTGLAADRARTGVLIFASLKDRQVEIVADKAIHDAVGDPVWDKAVAALIRGMRNRTPGQGFVDAIGLCGDALTAHFPADGPHDNRFSDELIEV